MQQITFWLLGGGVLTRVYVPGGGAGGGANSLFGSKANISNADFLKQQEKWKRDLKTSSFDVIVGNPPFQTPKKGKYSGSVGNRTLWDKFLDTIFHESLITKDGYLGIITPSNWRRPEHRLYKTLTRDNTLKYLHIYNKKAGLEKLGAQTRFDLYIVQEGTQKKESVAERRGTSNSEATSTSFLLSLSFFLSSDDRSLFVVVC